MDAETNRRSSWVLPSLLVCIGAFLAVVLAGGEHGVADAAFVLLYATLLVGPFLLLAWFAAHVRRESIRRRQAFFANLTDLRAIRFMGRPPLASLAVAVILLPVMAVFLAGSVATADRGSADADGIAIVMAGMCLFFSLAAQALIQFNLGDYALWFAARRDALRLPARKPGSAAASRMVQSGTGRLERKVTMLNPMNQGRPDHRAPTPVSTGTGSGGALWLIALAMGVVGLYVMWRTGAAGVTVLPVLVSVFFMLMFLLSFRRDARELKQAREARHFEQYELDAAEPRLREAGVSPREDFCTRRVFDRFDSLVIHEAERHTHEPEKISQFLNLARDFVDVPYAANLARADDWEELNVHLKAACERAYLQYRLSLTKEERDKLDSYGPPF
jgi:hypothetical protein